MGFQLKNSSCAWCFCESQMFSTEHLNPFHFPHNSEDSVSYTEHSVSYTEHSVASGKFTCWERRPNPNIWKWNNLLSSQKTGVRLKNRRTSYCSQHKEISFYLTRHSNQTGICLCDRNFKSFDCKEAARSSLFWKKPKNQSKPKQSLSPGNKTNRGEKNTKKPPKK